MSALLHSPVRRTWRIASASRRAADDGAGAEPLPAATHVAHVASTIGTFRACAAVALCAVLLSACVDVSMPDYKRPDTPAKASWSDKTGSIVSPADTIEPDWWKGFQDPYLNTLIAKGKLKSFRGRPGRRSDVKKAFVTLAPGQDWEGRLRLERDTLGES